MRTAACPRARVLKGVLPPPLLTLVTGLMSMTRCVMLPSLSCIFLASSKYSISLSYT